MSADDDLDPLHAETHESNDAPQKGIYPIKRLRRELRGPINAALGALRGGEFSVTDTRAAIQKVLRSINLNEYRDDIAWRVEEAERRQRNSSFGKAIARALRTDDLFTEELAREVWIPLGDDKQVCLADATHLHMQHKREEQRVDHEKVLQAMTHTDDFIAMLGPTYRADPTDTVAGAMRRMGRWSQVATATG